MWIPAKIFDLFSANRDDLTKARVELDAVKSELTRSQILNDWLRMQINTLQMERTGLIEKAYGIKAPTPILERTPVLSESTSTKDFSFDDIGDELAKKLGLPTYDS